MSSSSFTTNVWGSVTNVTAVGGNVVVVVVVVDVVVEVVVGVVVEGWLLHPSEKRTGNLEFTNLRFNQYL